MPDEYAYGGTRGYICKPCYIRKGSENTRRATERRKRLCPRCGVHMYDPKRGTMCNHCAPMEYIRVKERGKPTFHKPSGYWLVKLPPDDPMIEMANGQSYVRQHRLVMADHIGRPLDQDETVHHVNHDRGDNRIENLQLMARADHDAMHQADRLRARAEKYPPIKVDVDEMRRLNAVPGMRFQEMAEIMGVQYSTLFMHARAAGLTSNGRGRPTKAELARRGPDDPPVPERLR